MVMQSCKSLLIIAGLCIFQTHAITASSSTATLSQQYLNDKGSKHSSFAVNADGNQHHTTNNSKNDDDDAFSLDFDSIVSSSKITVNASEKTNLATDFRATFHNKQAQSNKEKLNYHATYKLFANPSMRDSLDDGSADTGFLETSQTAAPERYDPDWRFPPNCSERFHYQLYGSGGNTNYQCRDADLQGGVLPYFPMANSTSIEVQKTSCRNLCSMNPFCRAYSWSYHKLPPASVASYSKSYTKWEFSPYEVECRICGETFFNITEAVKSQNPESGFKLEAPKSGAISETHYKKFLDFSPGFNRVEKQCAGDNICAALNNGFALGEACYDEEEFESLEEFEGGSQDSNNPLYMTACLLRIYESYFDKKNHRIKCGGLYTVYDPDNMSSKISCRAYTSTRKTVVASKATAATTITTPMCSIPFDKATNEELMIPGRSDCRDRSKVWSRTTFESYPFDCSIVSKSDCEKNVGDINEVQKLFKWDMPKLKNAFVHEFVKDWCPLRCGRCKEDKYQNAEDED